MAIILNALFVLLEEQLFDGNWIAISTTMSSLLLLVFFSYLLSLQPQTTLALPFKVRLIEMLINAD